jgi:hypothetical protein
MADFCKQCSIDIFGKDHRELADITPKDAWEKGLAMSTICEGCGVIQVDPDGNCVSEDCLTPGPGHGLPWITQDERKEEEAEGGRPARDHEAPDSPA